MSDNEMREQIAEAEFLAERSARLAQSPGSALARNDALWPDPDEDAALAASQPPSGDAPDLREALLNLATASRNQTIVTVRYHQGKHTDEEMDAQTTEFLVATEAAFKALAAPSSPATPAPLDVARLHRAMEAVFAAGSDIELD
jgi:hypothetical protein